MQLLSDAVGKVLHAGANAPDYYWYELIKIGCDSMIGVGTVPSSLSWHHSLPLNRPHSTTL
jgi:hypothetical protein